MPEMRKKINNILFRLTRYSLKKHNEFLRWFYTEKLKSSINVIGKGVKINGKVDVMYPKGLLLGNNVHIGTGAHIDARAGIVIADNVHISRNLTIYSTNHNYEGESIPYDETLIPGSVVIEENVWIGMNVCITPGVTIGRGAIIGMGAVISKNINPGEIVVSSGQRSIGARNMDVLDIKSLEGKFGGVSGKEVNPATHQELLKPLLPSSDGGENIVFVLSTGRAGSNALASIMEQSSKIVSYHEPLYVFLKTISTQFLCGKITREEAKQKIEKFYSTVSLVGDNKIYLESDQKLVPFIDILKELFPSAKYIWLIRDPYKFALSATSRGWFSKNDKIKFFRDKPILDRRLSSEGQRNFLDYFEKYDSKNMSPFDKNVLYWKIWNEMIYREFLNLNPDKKVLLWLEDLDSKIDDLLKFVGIVNSKEIIKPLKTNVVKQGDKKKYEENKKKYEDYINSCKVNVSAELRLWKNL